MNSMLPQELARRWGRLQYIKQRGSNEWSAECPMCGSDGHGGREWPDRFRMFSDGKPRGWCRHCNYSEFADSDKKNFVITPEDRQRWIDERIAREQAEIKEAEHAIELLRHETQWLRWHTNMTHEGFEFWSSKGVAEWAINYYQLGYCPSKTVWDHDTSYTTPTATIPVFGVGWNLVNVRHRLINPKDPGNKYRPDRAGLPSSLFLTDPDNQPSGHTSLVEGEIKAIVLREYIDNAKINIVGIPGKRPAKKLLDQLQGCSRVYVTLDPDASQQAIDIAKALGPKRARVVTLPCKPDDMFTQYGATEREFVAALKQASIVE